MQSITFIGYGKMAKAIIKGLYNQYNIEVVGRDEKKLKELQKSFPNITISNLNGFNIEKKNIILAVKPYVLSEVANKLQGEANVLISILAGIKIENLKEKIKSKYTIRVMPNVAASYNLSTNTITGDEEFRDEAIKICNSFGNSIWLNSEKELDIATAIAGSGPAYLAIVAEALIDSGVRLGLKREDSTKISQGLFEGFAKILKNEHPALIKESVMSPAGTTAEGCYILEEKNTRATFMKAVEEAYKKALSIT